MSRMSFDAPSGDPQEQSSCIFTAGTESELGCKVLSIESLRAKIEAGLRECRAGRTVPAKDAWAELLAWRASQKP